MWFAVAAALVVVIGAPFYLVDILKGTTRPERATWLIWSIQGIVAFTTQALLQGGWSLLYIGLEALGNIAVLLLALRYGEGGFKPLDQAALLIAAIGIINSALVRQPVIALLGVIIADLAGVVLTLIKTYKQPSSETVITWLALGSAGVLTGLAVGHWSFSLLLYPLYLAVTCYAVVVTIMLGHLAGRRRTA